MTEQEKRELRMLGLDPQEIAKRVYAPEAKRWNPADYIGSVPASETIQQQEKLLGLEPAMSAEELAQLKKLYLQKLMGGGAVEREPQSLNGPISLEIERIIGKSTGQISDQNLEEEAVMKNYNRKTRDGLALTEKEKLLQKDDIKELQEFENQLNELFGVVPWK